MVCHSIGSFNLWDKYSVIFYSSKISTYLKNFLTSYEKLIMGIKTDML